MLVRQVIQEKTGMSRRQCFSLFAEGKVLLNDMVCENFKSECQTGDRVQREESNAVRQVRVGSTATEKHKVLLFHKPVGCVVARRDKFSQTIYDVLLEQFRQHYRYAGRLDNESSGLLLLTTDGDLVHQLTHPRYHIPKTYRVGLNKTLTKPDADALLAGSVVSTYDQNNTETDTLRVSKISGVGLEKVVVTLTEGKKRHIRRLFRHLGYQVRTLQRIAMGPLTLGSLEPGAHRMLTDTEIASLRTAIADASKKC